MRCVVADPVPADPAPPDARCAPPSDCAIAWEWEVSRRVEAVAKLAREEITRARAELAAATETITATREGWDKALALLAQLTALTDATRDEYSRMLRAMARRATYRGQRVDSTVRQYAEACIGRSEALVEVARLRDEAAESERALAEAREEGERLRAEKDRWWEAAMLATADTSKAEAELAALRRQAADELSREGQRMGLDEPAPSTAVGVLRFCYTEVDGVMKTELQRWDGARWVPIEETERDE